jgi:hypothetical protein
MLVSNNPNRIDDNNVDKIKIYKANTLKLKEINGIYCMIGERIDRLWSLFEKYIESEN